MISFFQPKATMKTREIYDFQPKKKEKKRCCDVRTGRAGKSSFSFAPPPNEPPISAYSIFINQPVFALTLNASAFMQFTPREFFLNASQVNAVQSTVRAPSSSRHRIIELMPSKCNYSHIYRKNIAQRIPRQNRIQFWFMQTLLRLVVVAAVPVHPSKPIWPLLHSWRRRISKRAFRKAMCPRVLRRASVPLIMAHMRMTQAIAD